MERRKVYQTVASLRSSPKPGANDCNSPNRYLHRLRSGGRGFWRSRAVRNGETSALV
jgi:hypothetical protein